MPNKLLRQQHKGQCFYLRQNKDYYLKELENNAKRSREKGYNNDRLEEIKRLHKKRRINTGLPQKKWDNEEIEYLKENYKRSGYKDIAIKLGRSTSSIEHKVLRLKLLKNHKYG